MTESVRAIEQVIVSISFQRIFLEVLAWRNYDVITPGMPSVSARGDREHPAFAGTSLFNFIAAPTLASWITKSLNAIEKCLRILGVCESHAHRCEICPV